MTKQQLKAEGERLTAILGDHGVTQEGLADEMEVAQPTISKWCNGAKAIPPKRLHWLAVRFGFNPVEFRPSLIEYMGAPPGLDEETQRMLAGIITKVMKTAAERKDRLPELEKMISTLS